MANTDLFATCVLWPSGRCIGHSPPNLQKDLDNYSVGGDALTTQQMSFAKAAKLLRLAPQDSSKSVLRVIYEIVCSRMWPS
ncbi:hypothetical protein KSP40_PGU009729 [Platanthera guangdongensis]|uniref:Uncharacterized protein n=1 Tax=Platanthera guangdongensis TaxID=2320717 RepID=A0ABR2M558_9ASPA